MTRDRIGTTVIVLCTLAFLTMFAVYAAHDQAEAKLCAQVRVMRMNREATQRFEARYKARLERLVLNPMTPQGRIDNLLVVRGLERDSLIRAHANRYALAQRVDSVNGCHPTK